MESHLDASLRCDGAARVKRVPMKMRKCIVITVLALALNMPVLPVSAAPSASIIITPPFHYPHLVDSEVPFSLVINVTDDGIPAVVKGTVLRQGTPVIPNPGGGTLACSEVNAFFTDPLGKFEFSLINPLSGTYRILAKYSGYLPSETTVTIPPSRDVGTTILHGGDVNADRVINIFDIGLIISKFGETNVEVRSDLSNPPMLAADCADPDEPADINDDGIVNLSDLAIAAGNWGRVGSTRWDTP